MLWLCADMAQVPGMPTLVTVIYRIAPAADWSFYRTLLEFLPGLILAGDVFAPVPDRSTGMFATARVADVRVMWLPGLFCP
ncbi:hypothetical protein Nepgr_007997 [Nepenthes gracilis]|uniref:Uncharacterized protein n=1 Tax=Nepenthes gracilis TaxID=150966 RepID=A0AAD3S7X6_NEPGR|nr:hypothetical protein Nepgr_007997 [Nepenthes gracilis]